MFKKLLLKTTINVILSIICFGLINSAYSTPVSAPLYFGFGVGYGDTDWDMLVAKEGSIAALVSPIGSQDTGAALSAVIGYYLSQYFAIEATYAHFPDTTVTFDAYNPTLPQWADSATPINMKTNTSAVGIYGKFIIPIGHLTRLHAFASAGVGAVLRKDILTNNQTKGHASGIFGAGFIYNFPKHFLTQLGFQLFTGYGKAETYPAVNFFPFLWQINAVFAFQIGV